MPAYVIEVAYRKRIEVANKQAATLRGREVLDWVSNGRGDAGFILRVKEAELQ